MNFEDLRKLIEDIKKTIACRECDGKLNDENIRIIGTVFNEGFFHGRCPECNHDMIINVIFTKTARPHRSLKKEMKLVTKNDILDMHNFLRAFNGDFISLFGKK
jgi:hypothetical protein